MFRRSNCALAGPARGNRSARARKKARLALGTLEDRVTPATALAPPTLLDPTAAIRVDQASYTIRGTFAEAAKNGATISAFRDTNQNGIYDAGVDALAGSASVPKKGTAFAVSVNLQQ